jgi:primosomal protein N' (replication factor Y)
MRSFVEVAINISQISDTFHYHVPPEFKELIQPGSLVIVPFGQQRTQGVVLRLLDRAEVIETKPIEAVVDEKPALTPIQIELVEWMAHETLSPLGACVNLMLPPGLSRQTDTLIQLNADYDIEEDELSPLEKSIITLLRKRGDLRGRQLDVAFRHVAWSGTIRKLARRGIVKTRAILPPSRVKPKTVRQVQLMATPEEIESLDEPLSRVPRVQDRRLEILRTLATEDDLLEPSFLFAQTEGTNGDLKVLEEAGLIRFRQVQVWRDPLEEMSFVPAKPPNLTPDQTIAWLQIQKALETTKNGQSSPPILMHGVTGSGKTEIYLKAVKETLQAGKRALIMVPEISWTPQTVTRFMARFPGEVGIMHSQLSDGERYDTWRRVRNGELSVIVGPRSALFLPVDDLGLIVMDECHHESYDQQEGAPYYRGVLTAEAYARLSGAVLILGSATPQVTQYYQAKSGYWSYIALPKRILAHRETIAHHARRLGIELPIHPGDGDTADLGLPQVSIVDMRQELKAGNRSIFSRALHGAIQQVLDAHQQAILFLNRRGTATYVFCRDCGHVIKCPRCDKPLTFHQSQRGLLCHTCGYTRNLPKKCPECGSDQIRQLGTGTEKVEKFFNEQFPGVRTLRWDAETTGRKGAHIQILKLFTNQAADVLIGTQMLAKGLDLPLVTLVGVILAEVGLNLPDFRATERTFQVLTQVAGRAGRSPLGGKVVLQTYQPESYAIQAASRHDYQGFYLQEMAYRGELGFPPFKRLIRLEYQHYQESKAQEAAGELAEQLRHWIANDGSDADFIGPAPCFFSKVSGRFRWQIILRGSDPAPLLRDRNLQDWIIEVDPSSLL